MPITKSTTGYVANQKEDSLARSLGWFSIGLGLTQLIAPRTLGRAIGVRNHTALLRFLGLREIASGIGLLTQPQPRNWLKARVAGDAMDLALLGAALTGSDSNKARVVLAAASVAAVTRLDSQASRHYQNRPEVHLSAVRVTRSVIIDKPAAELFAFWRNFENLPRIMSHVEFVQIRDERHSRWQVKGPAGTRMEWDAEIVNEHPNELIAWRSDARSKIQHAGSIRFSPAPGKRGTLVKAELEVYPPAGALGLTVAKLFGESPEKQIAVELWRFKQLMETGEIARTGGQPTGHRRRVSIDVDKLVRA